MENHKSHFKDRTGLEINGWRMLYLDPDDKRKYKRYWVCEHIACGNKKTSSFSNLSRKDGKITRCDYCWNQNRKFPIINCVFFKQIKRIARQRGIEFNLSKEYLEDLLVKQDFKCAISGVPIWTANTNKNHESHRFCTASLDRIDSTNGYIKGNVQFTHKSVNRFKWNSTDEELLWWAVNIVYNNLDKIDSLNIDIEDILCKKHTSGGELKEEQLNEIRSLYLKGDLPIKIAEQFDISAASVRYHTSDLRKIVVENRKLGVYKNNDYFDQNKNIA